jgi:hypothetical protein
MVFKLKFTIISSEIGNPALISNRLTFDIKIKQKNNSKIDKSNLKKEYD